MDTEGTRELKNKQTNKRNGGAERFELIRALSALTRRKRNHAVFIARFYITLFVSHLLK